MQARKKITGMGRMNRIRRGGKGEMVKRGRGIEKVRSFGDSSPFPLYPFTLFPQSFHPVHLVHPCLILS
jgi:hypothetical protein